MSIKIVPLLLRFPLMVVDPAVPSIALLVTAALGWLDEGIQAALPDRVYDPIDVGFNALAATVSVVGTATVVWIRERRSRRT